MRTSEIRRTADDGKAVEFQKARNEYIQVNDSRRNKEVRQIRNQRKEADRRTGQPQKDEEDWKRYTLTVPLDLRIGISTRRFVIVSGHAARKRGTAAGFALLVVVPLR